MPDWLKKALAFLLLCFGVVVVFMASFSPCDVAGWLRAIADSLCVIGSMG